MTSMPFTSPDPTANNPGNTANTCCLRPRRPLIPAHFVPLDPGASLHYEVQFGKASGRNCQRREFRQSGAHVVEPSLRTWVVPGELAEYLETDFDRVARNAVLAGPLQAGSFMAPIFLADSPGQGHVAIEGRVMDQRRRPLPEVSVKAVRYVPEKSMQKRFFGDEEPAHGSPKTAGRAWTGQTGAFQLQGLPDDAPFFEITCKPEGYLEATARVVIEPSRQTYRVNLVVTPDPTPSITVCGTVIDAAGAPIPGVKVSANSPRVRVYTDNDGWFAMPLRHAGDRVQCYFKRRGYVPHPDWAFIDEATGGSWVVPLLRKAEVQISGQAVFTNGAPAARMKLEFNPDRRDGSSSASLHKTETDENGYFSTLASIPEPFTGTVWLRARHSHSVHETRFECPACTILPGSQNVRLVFDNAAVLRVYVEPAVPLPPSRSFVVEAQQVLDANRARYAFVGRVPVGHGGGAVDFTGLSYGEYRVTVAVENASKLTWTQSISLSPERPAILQFPIPELAFGGLRVAVLEAGTARPISAGQVSIDGAMRLTGLSFRDGVFEVADLPAGQYYLSFTAPPHVVARVPIEVCPGEVTEPARPVFMTRFEDAFGWVQGRLIYDDGGPVLGAVVPESYTRADPVDGEGRYRIRMPAGPGFVIAGLDGAFRWNHALAELEADSGLPVRSDQAHQESLLLPVEVEAGTTIQADAALPLTTRRTIRLRGVQRPDISILVDTGEGFYIAGTHGAATSNLGDPAFVVTPPYRYRGTFRETAPGEIEAVGVPLGATFVAVHGEGFRGYWAFPAHTDDPVLVCEPGPSRVLAGRVLGPDGQPVAGISMSATCSDWPDLGAATAMRHHYSEVAHRPVLAGAKTDEDGRFTFPPLGHGRYEIAPWPARLGPPRAVEIGSEPMTPLEIRLDSLPDDRDRIGG